MYSEWLFQALPKTLLLNLTLLDGRRAQFTLAVLLQIAGPFSKGDKAESLIDVLPVTSHFLDIGNYGLRSVAQREREREKMP